MAFPGAIPSYVGFTPGHTLLTDVHASQHNLEQADIAAIASKIGTGASTPTSGLVLRGDGTGTSSWSQVILSSDVSGVLPVANGGTGTTNTTGTGSVVFGTSPTISTPTVSGGTFSSPTITTPTIASLTNATHNHQNAAGGGTLGSAAITGIDKSITTTDSNPYKFSAYLSITHNVGTADTLVQFNAENFDSNNNFDIVTNKGRYTAPVNGFYQVNANILTTTAGTGTIIYTSLYKNGQPFLFGSSIYSVAGANPGGVISGLVQLSASDYIEVYIGTGVAAKALDVGLSAYNVFSGYLVSRT